MSQNVHSGRWHGSDMKACPADKAKIAFFTRVSAALKQIMRQQATFLIVFSVPG